MSEEKEEHDRGSGILKEGTQAYTTKGLHAPCCSLCDEMNQCFYFFFSEFQNILHRSALAEARDTSTSEKHFNYSEALSVVKQFHPP